MHKMLMTSLMAENSSGFCFGQLADLKLYSVFLWIEITPVI